MKPTRYKLIWYENSFDGDTAAIESSTPFVPLSVGDYVDHRRSSDFMGFQDLPTGQAYRVVAVKHSFQDLGSHIAQYIHVCLQPGKQLT